MKGRDFFDDFRDYNTPKQESTPAPAAPEITAPDPEQVKAAEPEQVVAPAAGTSDNTKEGSEDNDE